MYVHMVYYRQINFNPRSPCGERPTMVYAMAYQLYISIHAPRVGSDLGPPPPQS